MDYSYKLGEIRDYRLLLFRALFQYSKMPSTEDRLQSTVVLLQSVVLASAINGIALALATVVNGRFPVQALWGFGAALAAAIPIRILSQNATLTPAVVLYFSALGVAAAAGPGGLWIMMAMGVWFGTSLASAFGISETLLLNPGMAVPAGTLFACAWVYLRHYGGWKGAAAAAAVLAVSLPVSLGISAFAAAMLESLRKSAALEWWAAELAGTGAAAGAAKVLSMLGQSVGTPMPPAGLLTLAFLLGFNRFPLWIFENLWAGIIVRMRSSEGSAAGELVSAYREAYFDEGMLLPLAGETALLRRIAELDQESALGEAVATLGSTARMLTAMSVISDLARTDPLGVQAGIQHHVPGKERTRILGFVTASLPPRLVRLLEAHTRLGEAAQKLEATRPPAPEPAGLVHQVLSPQRASARQQSVPDSSVEECLQNAIAAIDAAAGAYPGLRHTTEVAALYRALLFGIRARDLDDMGKFSVPDLPGHAVSLFPAGLRHTVRRLNRLAHTALSIKSATSGVNRRNLLLWANEQIEAVSSETRDAGPTFGPLLAFLTVRWRGILARAGGELSRATAPGPVPNPYVAGNPVVGSLFVGREDILRRLSELWSGEGQKPSVVLYGHRRMGKSSILHNLTGRFGPGTVVVDFNLQRTGHVEKTDELLLNLALSLYDSLDEQQKQALTEPASMNFMAFDRFLKNLDKVRNGRRFIVTLDEFEQIEQSIEDKRLDVELLTYFRGLIQTYPWLIMVFAGLHSLEEMRQDYWNPLFGSVTSIEVSFLSEAAARQLITQPTQEFDLDYDAGAVDLIIARTNGQPYLVQLICQALVTRFNREREQNPSRPRRFTAEDVQAVIGSPDFYRDGDAYFNGIYSQAESSPPPHQGTVLRALVGGLLSKAGLIAATGLDAAAVEGALATLSRHAVVREEGGRWCCTVELMRRWVETRDWGAEPAVV